MTSQLLPVVATDPHQKRVAERVNDILKFDFDSSRSRQAEEVATDFYPADASYAPYSSGRAGMLCDNTTDEANKVQALFDAAAATRTVAAARTVRLESGNNCIRCDSGLTLDASKVLLDGGGVTLNFENHPDMAFEGITYFTSNTDINDGVIRHIAHGIRNLGIQMPDRDAVTDGVALQIEDTTDDGSGNYRFACPTIEKLAIHGGAYGVQLGNGVFAAVFNRCSWVSQGGNNGGIAIHCPLPFTDGGEASHATDCFISNWLAGVVLRTGSFYWKGGNIDGTPNIGTIEGDGYLSFVDGYAEFTDGDDTTERFTCDDANASLEISRWRFNVRPDLLPERVTPLIYCDGSAYLHDINFRGSGTNWYKFPFLIDGSPIEVDASGVRYQGFAIAPLVSKLSQWFNFPDANNASVLSDFTATNSGGVTPARVTGVTDGAGSTRDVIRFQLNNGAASGSYSRLVFTRTGLIPGRRLTYVGQAFGALAGTNTEATATIVLKGVTGNTIATHTTVLQTSSIADFTTFGLDGGNLPPGIWSAELTVQLIATGTVSGNTFWNVSPHGFGYADGS